MQVAAYGLLGLYAGLGLEDMRLEGQCRAQHTRSGRLDILHSPDALNLGSLVAGHAAMSPPTMISP